MPRPVQPDSGALEHWRQRGTGPAAKRPDPGGQFGERERLGQVVVRAEVQPVHPVADPGRRGQHQHARFRAHGDDRAADLVAVDFRQIPV